MALLTQRQESLRELQKPAGSSKPPPPVELCLPARLFSDSGLVSASLQPARAPRIWWMWVSVTPRAGHILS